MRRASRNLAWIYAGGLVGTIAGACAPGDRSAQGYCEHGPSWQAMDGCNSCRLEDGRFRCTEAGCSTLIPLEGGCMPALCMRDVDDAPGLQVDCYVQLEKPGSVTTMMARCLEFDGALQLPEGEEVCWFPRTDDELSSDCRERGYFVDLEFVFEIPPAEDWSISSSCASPDLLEWIEGEAECLGPGPEMRGGVEKVPC